MEPVSPKTEQQKDIQQDIDALPEHLQQLCLSGKSVCEVAHLAKNIIQMVSGSAEVIELGLQRKQFDRVQRSWEIFGPNLKRLNKFLLDLIKYAQLYPIQKSMCDFNDVVNNVVRRYQGILKKQSIKLQLKEDKNIQPMLLDAERIEETIVNLITHALDNLTEQNGTIKIYTKHLEDHHQVQLSVCDNGPALKDSIIRSLSQPFERPQIMFGTGFDIPLAKIYIEHHDGYMELESTPDKGNCVHVYLPIK